MLNKYKPCHSIFINPRTIYKEPLVAIEVARGCGAHCRFCMLGYLYRRPRVLRVKKLMQIIRKFLKYTKTIKLFFEALPESCMENPFKELEKEVDKKKFGLRFGSIRADLISERVVRTIAKGGQKILIISPETASSHLRRFINKANLKDKNIINVVDWACKYEIPNFGMYFMVGFSTEKDKDLIAIAKLIEKVRKRINQKGNEKGILEVHINPFFIKPFTPLQWARMTSECQAKRKLAIIKKHLAKIGFSEEKLRKTILGAGGPGLEKQAPIMIKTLAGTQTVLTQPILAREDRRIAKVLFHVFRFGDKRARWMEGLRKYGLTKKMYFQKKGLNEKLPWSLITSNVYENYLKAEWVRAHKGIQSAYCWKKCKNCGVCFQEN